MHERRRDPRIHISTDVTVSIQSAPDATEIQGRVFTSRSIDISLHGLQLRTDLSIPVDSQLELNFVFDNPRRSFLHKGKVIWNRKCESEYPEAGSLHKIGISLSEPQDEGENNAWQVAVLELLINQGTA
jgi:hypothetical protein